MLQDLWLLIKFVDILLLIFYKFSYLLEINHPRYYKFSFQSTEESLQSQLYTIAIVFGVLYFLLILLFVALAFYIWR